ncbi:MAG: acyltransferase family protein [Acidimicrobiia bacterium]
MRVQAPPEPGRLDPPAPASAGASSFGYNPALDGIRAFAVLAVLLFHGGVLTGGYLGVDAFFVLSGFLITSLIVHEVHQHGRLDLKRFWARRARRLLPALFLLLFAVAAYAVVFADRTELRRIRGDALATLFYVANWHAIFAGHGYWDLFQAPSPLEHMWSLAIEEQFYLVWPLVMAGVAALAVGLARRRGTRTSVAPMVFGLALGAGIASAAWCTILFDAKDSSRAYLGTDTRIAAILFGAALAAWTVWRGPVRGRTARVLLEIAAVAAIVGIAVAWTRLNGQDLLLYRGGLLLCGLGVVVVIAAASHPTRGPIARALAWKPLVAIGLISYGLYLWHWPLYLVLNESRTGIDGNRLLALRIAASFAVAIASYFLVERPIRHHPLPRRVNLVVVPLAVCACIGAIYFSTANAVDAGKNPLATVSQGEARVSQGDATQGTDSAARRILIVGDSVGGNIATASQLLQSELGVQIGDATSPGCILPGVAAARTTINLRTQEIQFNPCAPIWLQGNQALTPGKIILVYGTAAGFTDLQIDGAWVGACDAPYQAWYERTLRDLIGQMNPEASVYLALIPAIEGTWIPDYANERIACINDVHRRIARTDDRVSTIDLASIVCPNGTCRETIGDSPFRIDGFHYSPPAAELVARSLLGEVTADLTAPTASSTTTRN